MSFWDVRRILSVGDSLSAQGGGASWQSRLLQRLKGQDVNFQFVGQVNGPPPIWHEGHAGFRIDQLGSAIAGYYAANPADVVMVLAGVNDIIADAVSATLITRMTTLCTNLFTARPSVEVVIAKIPPMATSYASYNPTRAAELVAYNAALPNVLASFPNRVISVIDCNTNYNPDTMHADGIHPNGDGAVFIADRFFKAGQRQPTLGY